MKTGNLCSHNKFLISLAIMIIAAVLGSACNAPGTTEQPSEEQNSGLVIRYLTAPERMQPSEVASILCIATDESNSDLSYEWSATGGEIEIQNEPAEIIWTAPDNTGNYTVTVVITNIEGVKATKSVDIVVTSEASRPPVVISMTCQNCKNVIEASRFSEYVIKCDASSPDDRALSYTWFATTGKITGNGAYANWFTGGLHGNTLITVIVTDDKGNKTEGYLAINVNCCH